MMKCELSVRFSRWAARGCLGCLIVHLSTDQLEVCVFLLMSNMLYTVTTGILSSFLLKQLFLHVSFQHSLLESPSNIG